MRVIHRMAGTTLAAAGLIFSASMTIHGADNLSPEVRQQLAAARAATAKYHDVSEALADGYVYFPNPAEGDTIEFVNFGLVDCTLDVLQPEALRYLLSGKRLRLVAVEYAIPMACSATPPEDFLPGAGEWEVEAGFPVWMLGVPLWSGNSGDAH